ncbi:class I SAM-dependent methyltransferase [Alkalicoccobacillus gibsonii]|uniref:Class I SAM-dependent methyltransferase n=1 Tax=Alkalicoccobacillus gibsonii TaxID=79881 RepID=A0ABU9VI88_9BACI
MHYTYMDLLAEYGIGSAHPGGFLLTKSLLKQLKIKPVHYVLDAGCGTGQTSSYLYSAFKCHVSAVDNHPLMIEKALNRFHMEDQEITLKEASIEQLPFLNESFDFVLSESVTAFTDIATSLSEFNRVLRSGGRLLLNEMVQNHPTTESERSSFSELYQIKDLLNPDQWREKLMTCGFSHIEQWRVEPISTLIQQKNDNGNDFFPSDALDSSLQEVWQQHQRVTQLLASKLSYLLVVAVK